MIIWVLLVFSLTGDNHRPVKVTMGSEALCVGAAATINTTTVIRIGQVNLARAVCIQTN